MILVIGGNGFLGRNSVLQLREAGYDVLSPNRGELNLLDHESVSKFDMTPVKGIINLAAKVGGIQFNINSQNTILSDNLRIALSVDFLARKASDLEWIIQVGTTCMYPDKTSVPFELKNLWNGFPVSDTAHYGIAKRIQLLLTDTLGNNIRKLNIVPVNLYGPGDNYKGINAHVIPALIERFHKAKVNGEMEVVVWGNPSVTREFLYVQDLVKYFIQWINCGESITLNAGTGEETAMSDLAEKIKQIVGYDGDIVFDAQRPTGNLRRLVESSDFRKAIPEQVDVYQGLKLTYEDYKSKFI